MGADNWGICPKCKRDALAAKAKEREKVGKAYGKVPAEKYLEMFEAATREVEIDSTLREDYGIGIDEDGVFSVSYTGSCRCGFNFRFKEEKPVLEAADE